jgi:hypothetical protein
MCLALYFKTAAQFTNSSDESQRQRKASHNLPSISLMAMVQEEDWE